MTARPRGALEGFLTQPLLHFVFLGVVVAAAHVWLGGRDNEDADRRIRITTTEVARMQAEWSARWNRPPTEEELAGIIRGRIREEVLYREAIAMGLDRDDPVVRRVLVQKLEGIARDLLEMSLAPTEQDLADYFSENLDRYRQPARISFTQVFLNPDRRGERTLADADRILEELRALDPPTAGSERYGDSFMLQRDFRDASEREVSRSFGREFARAVFELDAGRWQGPVLSGYGTHLVYVDAVTVYPDPTLADVEERVRQDWMTAKRDEISAEYFETLESRYDIAVERVASDSDGSVEPASTP